MKRAEGSEEGQTRNDRRGPLVTAGAEQTRQRACGLRACGQGASGRGQTGGRGRRGAGDVCADGETWASRFRRGCACGGRRASDGLWARVLAG